MTNLDLDQLQGLLFFFAGGAVLIFIALVVYISTASRRRKSGFSATTVGRPPPRADLPAADPVMSLLRTRSGGRLQVEIADARYQRLSDVQDPEIKRKIVATAMDLIQFTGVLDGEVRDPLPVDKTQTWREDVREGSQAELERAQTASEGALSGLPQAPTSPDVEVRFLNLLTDMGQTTPPPARPGLLDSIQHRLQPKPVEPRRARTFVDDIDDILQRRIERVPALTGRDLHIRPGPGGAVSFYFEGQPYASVDNIPNMTARQLIQDAIQEWDETA